MDPDGLKDLHRASAIVEDMTASQCRSIIKARLAVSLAHRSFSRMVGQLVFEVDSHLALEM